MKASPYKSVAEPTDPITRYLSPASSECSRRMRLAHSTYSGIDSTSMPTNRTIRFSHEASSVIPATDDSSSEKNSPPPDSRSAAERAASGIVASPAMKQSDEIPSASVSRDIAPATIGAWTPRVQIHTDRPSAVESGGAVVHRALVEADHVDGGEHDAGARDDPVRELVLEGAEQDVELTDEVRRARHRERRERDDQEQPGEHRRTQRDPAHARQQVGA